MSFLFLWGIPIPSPLPVLKPVNILLRLIQSFISLRNKRKREKEREKTNVYWLSCFELKQRSDGGADMKWKTRHVIKWIESPPSY